MDSDNVVTHALHKAPTAAIQHPPREISWVRLELEAIVQDVRCQYMVTSSPWPFRCKFFCFA